MHHTYIYIIDIHMFACLGTNKCMCIYIYIYYTQLYTQAHVSATCMWDLATPNVSKCKKVAHFGTMITFIRGWIGFYSGFHGDNFPQEKLEFKHQPQEQVESHGPIRIHIWLAQISTSRGYAWIQSHDVTRRTAALPEARPVGSPSFEPCLLHLSNYIPMPIPIHLSIHLSLGPSNDF